ncbi:hypothetical protein BDW68DRAFT_177210 [Aspergillus falconensis]
MAVDMLLEWRYLTSYGRPALGAYWASFEKSYSSLIYPNVNCQQPRVLSIIPFDRIGLNLSSCTWTAGGTPRSDAADQLWPAPNADGGRSDATRRRLAATFHGFGRGSLDSDLSLDYVPSALPTSSSIFVEPNSLSSVAPPLAWDIAPPETEIEFLAEFDSVLNLQGQMGELRDQHTAPWMEILHCDPDEFWFSSEDLRRMWRKTRDLELALATSKMPSEWLYWSPGPTTPEVPSLIPPRATCDVLLELYVNTFESASRILHIPSFYQGYREYWSSPDSISDVFLCKLLLAMAIGTFFATTSPSADQLPGMRSRALAWMHHGQQ